MRLVLVDNFVMPERLDPALFDVHPHLGLASLGAVARRENHDVAVYDPKRAVRYGRHAYDGQFYARAAEDILALAPDAVGFTTLGCSLLFAVKVADIIRARERELPILLGGPHATMLDRQILEAYGQFDIIARHEAEETLPPLLANLEARRFDRVPGLTWRNGRDATIKSTPGLPKIEDLDRLPIPAYDLYPVPDLGLDLMRVEAGRGCPFVCAFCSTASFFQRDYRLKSPDRIVREMDFLHERYGTNEFKLDHDLFTVNRRKVWAFCEAVEQRDYRWRVSARTDCVDDELLEKMALAGCIGLYFGIETGSKRMQRIADKRLKLDGVDHILDVAENLGIETTVSFITGYPEETREDQDATLDMLGRCFARPQDSCTPQLHMLVPEPGTPLFAKHRAALAYDGYATRFNARLLGADDRRHVLAFPDLYASYYHYPAVLPRAAYTLAVDAVDALRAAGHEVLTYALRYFGGRLSRLSASLAEWAGRHRPGAAVDTSLVLDFVSDWFGATHHLTSLFRFGLAIGARRGATPADDAVGERREPDGSYRLSPQACLLAELHDCPTLLERIRLLPGDAAPLDPGEAGELGCYMMIVAGDRSIFYRIDLGVEAILRLFDEPRSLRDAVEILQGIAPDSAVREDLFDELIAIGALTRRDAQQIFGV
jgi:radical SAM superfamily enzyme YgiQ (UPF0313 family)